MLQLCKTQMLQLSQCRQQILIWVMFCDDYDDNWLC